MTSPADPVEESELVEVVDSDSFEGGLKGATVRGTAWTAASQASQQIIQVGITIVLARLLLPREYGLVGMVAVFTGFAMLFVYSGFGAAIVQRNRLTAAHLATAFWANLGAGIAIAALAAAFAPLVALFYGQPEIVSIMPVAALGFILASLSVVQTAILERRMMFRRIALVENVSLVGAGAVATVCAVAGLGVWSLVVFSLVSNAVESSILWILSDWRPTRTFDRMALRDLWGFSGGLLGSQAINYWNRNLDNLLVGRFVGAYALGIYTRAYTLMMLPLAQVSSVAGRTLFPALSRMQESPERVRRAYLRAVGVIAFLTFPIATGLYVAARPLILTLLGARWAGVVPLLQILSVAIVAQSIATTAGNIYQSQGRTDWEFRWQIFAGVTAFVAFGIGVHWGVKGVAVAVAARSLVLLYPGLAIPGRLIGMRFGDVALTVWPVLVAALLASAGAWLVGRSLVAQPSGVQLLAEIATATCVYVACAHLGRLKPYRDLCDIVFRGRGSPAGAVAVPTQDG